MKTYSHSFKQCPTCHVPKVLGDYSKNVATKDGYAFYCRECANAMSQASYRRRRAAALLQTAPKCARHRSRQEVHGGSRHYHLVRRYGLTAQQVGELIDAQAGLCGICSRELGDKPHVDHNHETGAVRGILCFNCNGGLGQFGDDIERLVQAIEYLQGNRTPGAQAARATEQRLLELIDRFGRVA